MKLKGRKTAKPSDVKRLQKELDKRELEIKRLAATIRKPHKGKTLEALQEELDAAENEYEAVKNDLERAQASIHPQAPRREAEQIADRLTTLCECLTGNDPALQREALRTFVAKIECRFDRTPSERGKRRRYPLAEARVLLQKQGLLEFLDLAGRVGEIEGLSAPWTLTVSDAALLAAVPRRRRCDAGKQPPRNEPRDWNLLLARLRECVVEYDSERAAARRIGVSNMTIRGWFSGAHVATEEMADQIWARLRSEKS